MKDYSVFFTGIRFKRNVLLSSMTTFEIGGNASLVLYPATLGELTYALVSAARHEIPLLLIGGGSNTLASDDGFDGVVISLGRLLRKIGGQSDSFLTQAGAKLCDICKCAEQRSIGGFEFMRSIPGCIGASVVGNAGCFGFSVSELVKHVWAIDLERLYGLFGNSVYFGADGNPKPVNASLIVQGFGSGERLGETDLRAVKECLRCFDREELTFGYRSSSLKGGRFAVISVELQGHGGFDAELSTEIAKMKATTQPIGQKSAGSTFLSSPDFFPSKAIDELGLKGFSVGGASVSERHAGFIVNNGNATERDVSELIEIIRLLIKQKYGVILQTEISRIGDGRLYNAMKLKLHRSD